jgi:hypothetical protein
MGMDLIACFYKQKVSNNVIYAKERKITLRMRRSHKGSGLSPVAKSTIVFLALPVVLLFSDVVNPDRPLKGEWDLDLQLVWEIDRAGPEVFLQPDGLKAAEDGTLYVHDGMNRVNYIFDPGGRFVRSFGKKGQGPGEIQDQKSSFLVGQTVVVVDTAKIHYFSRDGEYLKSENNYYYRRRPALFVDERRFIAAPIGIFEAFEGKGKIVVIDLESGRETLIHDFLIFSGGTARVGKMVGSLIVEGLTPLMTIGYSDGRIYYGMSDNYSICIADLNGKRLGTFSLERKKGKVSPEEKAQRFEDYPQMSRQGRRQIMETTPDEVTSFTRIELHRGLIYVLEPEVIRRNFQAIDIFSPEGRYLYRSKITVDEDLTMVPQQSANPLLTDTHLYVALMDKDLNVRISKYKISLPGREVD